MSSDQGQRDEISTHSTMNKQELARANSKPDCPSCHNHLGPWVSEPSLTIKSKAPDRSWKTWREVVRSSQCSNCCILMAALQSIPPPDGLMAKDDTVIRVRYRRHARNCYEFGFHNLSRETHFHDDGKDDGREHTLEIYPSKIPKSDEVVDDDPELGRYLNSLPTFRNVIPNAASPEAFNLVRHWIKECQDKHQSCNDIQEHRLPTRLIDTQGDDATSICLVDGADLQAEYVALSYCWGQDAPALHTNDANIRDYMTQGISIENLPALVRDAVTVTKKLGYRYLWIDRLCVIQGNAKDWAIESGKMCDVFADATLTISADNSASIWQGMLKDQVYSTTVGSDDVRIADVIARKKAPHATFDSQKTERTLPTYRRAWTLQEQYLSRRVLHYTQNEMIWECLEKRSCECRRDYGPSDRKLSQRQSPDVQQVYQDWAELVHEYTTRALTNEDDKLPAISGLATRIDNLIAEASGVVDIYLAGLWRADLAAGLCWLPPTPEDRDAWLRNNLGPHPTTNIPVSESESELDGVAMMRYTQGLHRHLPNVDRRRPKNYTAPTWSWASLNGPASYFSNPGNAPFQSAIQILEAETTPSSQDDRFGQVLDGKVTLRGPIVHDLTLEQGFMITKPENGFQVMLPDFQLTDFRDENQIEIKPDDPTEIAREGSRYSKTVSCLMVGHRRAAVQRDMPLREIAKLTGPSYTRVGTLEYEQMESPPEYQGDAGRRLVWDMCQTCDGWEYDDVFAVDLAPEVGPGPHLVPFSFFLVLMPVADRPGVYERIACFEAGWNHVDRGVMKSMFKKRGTKDTVTIV